MRVLLIEDDKSFAKSVELMLRSEHIEVVTSDLGDDGVLLSKLFYDIIVLDLELPDMTGLEVLAALRAANIKTPVLILTGNAMVESKVEALGFGADDYMTKPFHKDELVARIRAVVRRSKGQAHAFGSIGAVTVNLNGKTVDVEGVRSHLTDKEYQGLFKALAPFLLPSQRASFEGVSGS